MTTHSVRLLIVGVMALIGGACGSDPAADSLASGPTVAAAVESTAAPQTTQAEEDDVKEGDTPNPTSIQTVAFGPLLDLNFDREVEVLAEDPGRIAVGLRGTDAANAVLLIRPDGVLIDESGSQTAPFPGDLGAWLDAAPHVAVVSTGDVDGTTYWDIESAPTIDGDECNRGSRCAPFLLVESVGILPVAERESTWFRVYDAEIDGERLLALSQALPTAVAEVDVLAADLLDDACFCGAPPATTVAPAEHEPERVMASRDEPLAPGVHEHAVGAMRLTFDIVQPVELITVGGGNADYLALYIHGDPVPFSGEDYGEQLGMLLFDNASLVHPDVMNTSNQGPKIDEYGGGLVQWSDDADRLEILDSGVDVIGGVDASWVHIEMAAGLDDALTYECNAWRASLADSFTDRCLSITVGPNGFGGAELLEQEQMVVHEFDGATGTAVLYAFDEMDVVRELAGVLLDQLTISSTDTLDPLAEFERVRDGLLLELADEDADFFCTHPPAGRPSDEVLRASTPAELEAAWADRLELEYRYLAAAPESVRTAQAGLLASLIFYLERLESADWDERDVPLGNVPTHEFVAFTEVDDYLAANC